MQIAKQAFLQLGERLDPDDQQLLRSRFILGFQPPNIARTNILELKLLAVGYPIRSRKVMTLFNFL